MATSGRQSLTFGLISPTQLRGPAITLSAMVAAVPQLLSPVAKYPRSYAAYAPISNQMSTMIPRSPPPRMIDLLSCFASKAWVVFTQRTIQVNAVRRSGPGEANLGPQPPAEAQVPCNHEVG